MQVMVQELKMYNFVISIDETDLASLLYECDYVQMNIDPEFITQLMKLKDALVKGVRKSGK